MYEPLKIFFIMRQYFLFFGVILYVKHVVCVRVKKFVTMKLTTYMRGLFLSLLCCLLCSPAVAQKKDADKQLPRGYNLTLTVKGGDDTVMYMGYYYVGKTYAVDTARVDKKGRFVFASKTMVLRPGMYFFTNPSGNYVEFIVYNEAPNFVFETESRSWNDCMKVKGSKENELFYDYHRANKRLYNVLDSARQVKTDEEAFKAFYKKCQHELDSLKLGIIENNPERFLSLMMNATRDPKVPTADSTGRTLSQRERYEYYMNHYFDYMALDNDAMVRTPDAVFHKRVMDYLDKNLKNAGPEVIIEYVDKMIDRSIPSKEVFKYLVHTITERYLQSNIMSYDAIYVHLVKKYFATELNYWSAPSVIDEQMKRANTWEHLLIGKTAPDLMLHDADGTWHTLSGLRHKYTLLVFWSPTCGHCKTVIPELYKKYSQYKEQCDIGSFCILSEPDEETYPKWHRFIKDNGLDWLNLDGGEANIDWHEVYDVITTPQIYLLDKDKKILAKKLNADSFEMVIKALEHLE